MLLRRKLIRQGGGGFTVYLPKKWVDRWKLDQTQEVTIEILEGSLLVTPDIPNYKTETTIKLVNLAESAIRTVVTNAYRTGYDRIILEITNEKQLKILQNVVESRLIGFEIVKKDAKKCIIENLTEPSSEQFEALLKKVIYNVSEIFEITKQTLTGEEPDSNVEEVEARIQKYDNFCRRVISKEKVRNQKSELLWTFLALFIHAQRELYHLNTKIEHPVKVSAETLELLESTREIFETLKSAYLEKNTELLQTIHKMQKTAFYESGFSQLQSAKGQEVIIVHYLMASTRQFYLANSPLLGYLI